MREAVNKIRSNEKAIELLHYIAIVIVVLAVVWINCIGGYVFGSTIDWVSQHSVIPDYYREHFYKTGDIVSQFTMNIGAGQNSFNFVYHGYLTPVVLLSYLLPFVPMKSYIIGASIVVVILSAILFYNWIKPRTNSLAVTFAVTLLFIFSTPILYHSHKQIMFVQYMPFLIMALIGVDRLYNKGKSGLLAVSVLLLLMTNFYFSVSAVVAITVYAIYSYLESYDIRDKKIFFKWAGRYAIAMISAALMSLFVMLPAFLAILGGRTQNTNTIQDNPLKHMIPKLSISGLMYSPYGMGLVALSLIAILYFAISKNKARRFLGITLTVAITLPMVWYVLNMGLYARTKVLIPFMPIVLMMTGRFIVEVYLEKRPFNNWILISPFVYCIVRLIQGREADKVLMLFIDGIFVVLLIKLTKYYKQAMLLVIPTVLFAGILTNVVSYSIPSIDKLTAEHLYGKEKQYLIDKWLEKDEGLYRSNDNTYPKWTSNYIYNEAFNQTGLYSSIYNKDYNYFTHHTINLSNTTVNDIATPNTNDWLFNQYMGVKYMICEADYLIPKDYVKVENTKTFILCKNEKVFSVLTGNSRLMSEKEFKSLGSADRKLAMLEYVIVDDNTLPQVYDKPLKKLELEGLEGVCNKSYKCNTMTTESFDISMYGYDGYIVEITVPHYPKKPCGILVNDIRNDISAKSNAFPKSNMTFSYVVTSREPMDKLTFDIIGGDLEICDISCYGFDTCELEEKRENFAQGTNLKMVDSNTLEGNIDMAESGYINISIPYDKGFSLYIDGNRVPIEKTCTTFMGAKIEKGSHNIRLSYTAPGFKTGCILSIIGIIIFVVSGMVNRDKKESDS